MACLRFDKVHDGAVGSWECVMNTNATKNPTQELEHGRVVVRAGKVVMNS